MRQSKTKKHSGDKKRKFICPVCKCKKYKAILQSHDTTIECEGCYIRLGIEALGKLE